MPHSVRAVLSSHPVSHYILCYGVAYQHQEIHSLSVSLFSLDVFKNDATSVLGLYPNGLGCVSS